ncbi:DEA(D/H)-box RNA helicase family protein [Artemisia annua]|uniref:RNA helicase n=1 Tax=Artemisia annua TaxID=35608 RepID=A0A2U1KYH3_ARTAN|nr:DEA(D/H)-box RNA helicase family protein [Artemisia annua]
MKGLKLAEAAKAQFSGRDNSDHLALLRAFDGWKAAERQQSGHEYCWRNFLSSQTLRAIDSLKKQFSYLLRDSGLVENMEKCNTWSHDQHLIRAIICSGLFPGICSVVNKEKSVSLKTMEDGPVLLYSNSVNSQDPTIPYPWLVFNEKVKVNSVFLRDSTAVSDSVVLIFGGSVSRGLAEAAKAQFSGRDNSDHLALLRAFDGWKAAERQQSGHEYCWRNFLSSQTLRAIDSLKKQFSYLLRDSGLVENMEKCNTWSHDQHLIRTIICSGLFPGICSVVNKEKSVSLKTMEDGPVLLYSNSVNSQEPTIPYPWLVFNEKVKVNSVFLRDSTAVSDSVVLIFGGSVSRGVMDGHLKMLGGYLEFFMKPGLAGTYLALKRELDELIQMKLLNPKIDIGNDNELLESLKLLVSGDRCEGRFVYGRKPSGSKKLAEKSAASEALQWLTGETQSSQKAMDHISTVVKMRGEVHALQLCLGNCGAHKKDHKNKMIMDFYS